MKQYELKDVKKYYGDNLALDIRSLTLYKGILYVVYGPNGAGKTTLLNLLAFLDRATEGDIIFYNGHNNAPNSNDTRKTTLAMQNPYLFDTTVLKNVISGLTFRSISARKAEEMVEPIMRQFGIWQLRTRHIDSISGGERKKVALARAVVLDTEVLLLDEPTSHIDRANIDLIENMIRCIIKDGKRSVIMTTHDLSQAHRLTSDIIYLLNGKLEGVPLWNLFQVFLTGYNNVKKAQLGTGVEIFVAAERNGPAKIAIDPKDIIISRKPFKSSALNNLKARTVGIDEVGGLVDLRVDAGVRLHALITHRSFRNMDLKLGDEVYVVFKASAIEVF